MKENAIATVSEIPLRNDLFSYQQLCELSGVVYTLSFNFNALSRRWFMSIGDAAGVDIVSGVPMSVGYPLTLGVYRRALGLPSGQFILLRTGAPSRDEDHQANSMGTDLRLVYIEP